MSHILYLNIFYFMQKVIEAFTKAEAIKSKLREKYAIIETQKRAVEVS